MSKSRIFAMTGAGLAAAAAIVAMFITPGRGSQVQAATIFRNLRETAHRGLRVQFENIRAEGIAFNARVEVLFPVPVTVAQLVSDHVDDIPGPQAVYIEAGIVAGPSGDPDVAGLDVKAALAFTEADSWAFVKLNELPQQLVEEQPFITGLLGPLRNGVLLDLNGLEDLGGIWGEDDEENEQDEDEAENEPTVRVQQSVHIGGGHTPANDSDQHSVRLDVQVENTASPEESWEQILADLESGQPLDEVMRQFLTGELTRDQLPQFVSQIEELAQTVTVHERDDGSWLLVARDFRIDGEPDEDAQFIRNAVLQIGYREGAGVTFAEFSHLGDGNGRIRFEFIDAIDPALLSRDRYAEGHSVIDVRALLSMFGAH